MANKLSKRTQHCTICKNHGNNAPKKSHNCPYLDCRCRLCTLTRKSQMAMRHQQRVWRHQKQKLKSKKFDNDETLSPNNGENKLNKSQACDKCRNHNILKQKRNHQCPFQDCNCALCSLTFKRRELMKHQQRVRRSRITSEIEADGAPNSVESEDCENDCSYYRPNEEEPGTVCKYDSERSTRSPSCSRGGDVIQRTQGEDGNAGNGVPVVSMETVAMSSCSSSSSSSSSPPDSEANFPSNQTANFYPTECTLPEEQEPKRIEESPPLPHLIQLRDYKTSPVQLSPPLHDRPNSPPRVSYEPAFQHDPQTLPHPFDHCHPRPESDEYHQTSHNRVLPPHCSDSPDLVQGSVQGPFPFRSSQPQRVSNGCTGMDPMKFGTQLQDLRLQGCNWVPPTVIRSSLGNATSLLLPHQQEHPSSERLHSQQEMQHTPIHPLPLNMPPRHNSVAGPFSEQIWNRMFLSFNFGLRQNCHARPELDRFHGAIQPSRYPI